MIKYKAAAIITVLVMVIALVITSCSPAAAPAKPPVSEPAKPAVSDPVKPVATLPADTKPAPATNTAPAAKVSFEAATYTNDQYGFSFQYPKSWVEDKIVTTEVCNFGKGTAGTDDHVIAIVIPQSTDMPAAYKTEMDNIPGMKQFNMQVSIKSSKQVTLADGKTPATEIIATSDYNMWCYAIGFNKNGKTIIVSSYTLLDAEKLLREIIGTVAVK
jgi:hypothetical protein